MQSQILTLDAGSGFSSYHWSDNSSDQTLVLDGSTIIIGQHLYSVTVTDNNSCANSDDIIVTVVDDSGIEFFGGKAKLSVYPNPSNGIINIDIIGSGIFNVEIYNALGNKIIEKAIDVPETGIKDVIDLSGNSKGIYIVKFEYLNSSQYRLSK